MAEAKSITPLSNTRAMPQRASCLEKMKRNSRNSIGI